MIDHDRVVLETTSTRRQRTLAALVFGKVQQRRTFRSNAGRLVGSVVLAAVLCAGCLGASFVIHTLHQQKVTKAVTAYDQAIRQARKPDPKATVDPRTGFPIDPDTHWVVGLKGHRFDVLTGWEVDTSNGYLIEPSTGLRIDPSTGRPANEKKG